MDRVLDWVLDRVLDRVLDEVRKQGLGVESGGKGGSFDMVFGLNH